MRNRSDERLGLLNAGLIRMDSPCEGAIRDAFKTPAGESAFAEQVYTIEHEINQKGWNIENLCLELLLKQQPAMKDSQLVLTVLKVISDMERIGDQASDIVEITVYLKGSEVESKVHINGMVKVTMKTMTANIDSFVKKNLKITREVIKSDDVVDDLFDRVGEELIGLIGENCVNGEFCINLLVIAKYPEQTGDHAANTAKWVEYSTMGTHITTRGE